MRLAQVVDGVVINVIECGVGMVPDWAEDWPEVSEAGLGWTYANGVFSAPQEPTPEDPKLTPQQWSFFLDYTGFGAILEGVLVALPKTTQQERLYWAGLKAVATNSAWYELDQTLGLVAQVRSLGVPGLPTIPTDGDIEAAWVVAASFNGIATIS